MGESTWYPASAVENFNVERFDFQWNADFTKFQAVPFTWWGSESCRAFVGAADEDYPVPHEPPPPPMDDDDIPY